MPIYLSHPRKDTIKSFSPNIYNKKKIIWSSDQYYQLCDVTLSQYSKWAQLHNPPPDVALDIFNLINYLQTIFSVFLTNTKTLALQNCVVSALCTVSVDV